MSDTYIVPEHRHFYLYAKGWYKKTNIIEDLKILVSNYSGIDNNYISEEDIINILSNMIDYHINYSNPSKLISKILEIKRYSSLNKEELSINELLILSMLSILTFLNVSEIPIDLGSPDSNILSLRE